MQCNSNNHYPQDCFPWILKREGASPLRQAVSVARFRKRKEGGKDEKIEMCVHFWTAKLSGTFNHVLFHWPFWTSSFELRGVETHLNESEIKGMEESSRNVWGVISLGNFTGESHQDHVVLRTRACFFAMPLVLLSVSLSALGGLLPTPLISLKMAHMAFHIVVMAARAPQSWGWPTQLPVALQHRWRGLNVDQGASATSGLGGGVMGFTNPGPLPQHAPNMSLILIPNVSKFLGPS